MEELHEADVMWPADGHERPATSRPRPIAAHIKPCGSSRYGTWTSSSSAPMDVPRTPPPRSPAAGGYGGDDKEDAAELVPPHVLAASRGGRAEKAAFSVCTGQGRTLKGRDLRHVRNSVLRMTGFLEG